MNKLLAEAKALNIPRRNSMKKDQLTQAIKDTVNRYKEIIFGSDVICIRYLDELKKQRRIDKYTNSKKLLEQAVRYLSHCSHENVDGWGNDGLHGLWFNTREVGSEQRKRLFVT